MEPQMNTDEHRSVFICGFMLLVAARLVHVSRGEAF